MMAAVRRRLIPRTVPAASGGQSPALFSTQNNKALYPTSPVNRPSIAPRCAEGKRVAAFSSLNNGDKNAVGSSTNGSVVNKQQPITVCAMNNHPDYRLKLARERIQNTMKSSSPSLSSPSSPPSSTAASMASRSLPELRKNDGSSSGAVTEKRLREKRQEILDSMASTPQTSGVQQNTNGSNPIASASIASRALPEPRKNDGSSSGAVTEKRLREKRQAILDSMASSPQISNVQQNTVGNSPILSASIASRSLPEPRKNDGSSSGALTEQRLREKRQAMLDSMASTPESSNVQQNTVKSNSIASASIASRALPEPRKNDGSSSGALTEQRLREKRQAILDKLAGK